MKNIAWIFLLLSSMVRADVFDHPINAAAAERLLAPSRVNMPKAAALTGDFVQTQNLTDIPMPLVSSGDFVIAKGQGVLWNVKKPVENRLAITPKGIQQTSRGNRSVQDVKNQPGIATVIKILDDVFNLKTTELAERFYLYGQSDAKSGAWHLGLKPKDATLLKMMRSIELQGNADLATVTLLGAGADRTHIAFSSQAHQAELTPEQTQALTFGQNR